MNTNRSYVAFILYAVSAACSVWLAGAQAAPEQRPANVQFIHLPSGIEVNGDGLTLRVTALRDDVLRVRASHHGRLPEDSSWAVLAVPRAASVMVTEEATGFRTNALRVSFDRTLRLSVSDLSGHVLQQ